VRLAGGGAAAIGMTEMGTALGIGRTMIQGCCWGVTQETGRICVVVRMLGEDIAHQALNKLVVLQ
jgi:hypothetical protein